jgi:hypothetical protein
VAGRLTRGEALAERSGHERAEAVGHGGVDVCRRVQRVRVASRKLCRDHYERELSVKQIRRRMVVSP